MLRSGKVWRDGRASFDANARKARNKLESGQIANRFSTNISDSDLAREGPQLGRVGTLSSLGRVCVSARRVQAFHIRRQSVGAGANRAHSPILKWKNGVCNKQPVIVCRHAQKLDSCCSFGNIIMSICYFVKNEKNRRASFFSEA
jgi:hypothetical protein